MRNPLMRLLLVFSSLLAFYGCMTQPTDENAELSQEHEEEVSNQELLARRPRSCVLPIKPGPCRAYFERYAFDAEDGQCVKFIYGGCQGNANNFESYGECRRVCGSRRP